MLRRRRVIMIDSIEKDVCTGTQVSLEQSDDGAHLPTERARL